MKKFLYTTAMANGRPDWDNVRTTRKAARQDGDGRIVQILAEVIGPTSPDIPSWWLIHPDTSKKKFGPYGSQQQADGVRIGLWAGGYKGKLSIARVVPSKAEKSRAVIATRLGAAGCHECGMQAGHRIGCKTGNDRAKESQAALSKRWRSLTPAQRREKTKELDRRLRS